MKYLVQKTFEWIKHFIERCVNCNLLQKVNLKYTVKLVEILRVILAWKKKMPRNWITLLQSYIISLKNVFQKLKKLQIYEYQNKLNRYTYPHLSHPGSLINLGSLINMPLNWWPRINQLYYFQKDAVN